MAESRRLSSPRTLVFAVLLCAVCLSLTPGCGRNSSGSRRRRLADMREQLERERKAAQEARHDRDRVRLSRRNWQVMAVGLCGTAVVLLVVGTAMGSAARRDADSERGEP